MFKWLKDPANRLTIYAMCVAAGAILFARGVINADDVDRFTTGVQLMTGAALMFSNAIAAKNINR